MDDRLRELQRRAANDPAVEAALRANLDRIGRQAPAYTGPDPVPVCAVSPPRRDSCPRDGGKDGVPRHRTMCASAADALERSLEKRARRVGRAQCDAGLEEWLEERGR